MYTVLYNSATILLDSNREFHALMRVEYSNIDRVQKKNNKRKGTTRVMIILIILKPNKLSNHGKE